MALFGRKVVTERTYKKGEIRVSDSEALDRIRFVGLTEDDLGVIATWEAECRRVSDHLVDEFYAHIFSNATTKGILSEHSSVDRQRPMLTRYVLTMFGGRVDDQYLEYRKQVGRVHDRIDLDSNWYVAMYEVIRRVVEEGVAEAGASDVELVRFTKAFSKLIQVDIALVITALTDSRRAQI